MATIPERGMGRLAALDKGSVIRVLEATGSHDPDVLYARATQLFTRPRLARLAGWCLMLAGLSLCFVGRGTIPGIPLALLGWWARHRAGRTIATIRAGFSEYTNTPAA